MSVCSNGSVGDEAGRLSQKGPGDGDTESMDRRGFLGLVGTGGALAATGGVATPAFGHSPLVPPSGADSTRRSAKVRAMRVEAADTAFGRGAAVQATNGDEEAAPSGVRNYSKCLPHNSIGEPEPRAYAAYVAALKDGSFAAFDRIALAPGAVPFGRLHSPQAGLAFELEGPDGQALAMPPCPAFQSAEQAGELVELYWMALCRDVPFSDYRSSRIVERAAAELSSLSVFRGTTVDGKVTPATVFRGSTPGETIGPMISQLLLKSFNYGSIRVDQRHITGVPGANYLADVRTWLSIQNGGQPEQYRLVSVSDAVFIRNLRDLARALRDDPLYQFYFNAALILLQHGVPMQPGNPYRRSANQQGFATFGPPHIFWALADVSCRALRAVWYQKWFVHRRIRPEEFAGRVHHQIAGAANYGIHADVLDSTARQMLASANRTSLLPMAYPEGCPPHPSYGAGHNVIAGACATILKAFFDMSVVFPGPVESAPDGRSLVSYRGSDVGRLTVLNEINKLVGNVALGRNCAGVHWRSEHITSAVFGETLAIQMLAEQKACYNEPHTYTIIKFDGSTVTI